MRSLSWGHRLLGVILLSSACSALTAVTDGDLTVERQPSSLTLRNAAPAPIHYYVVERTLAERVEWSACIGPGCAEVPPGGSVTVANSLIAGYTPAAREAVVYWWQAEPDGEGGVRADSIRSLITPL